MNKSEYNFSLDFIRVLAILGVVIIHTTNAVYTRPDFFGGITWWVTIILDSLSRISIPLFILISGYLILRKDESFTQNLKRIFFRVFIPLVIWTIFYMWYGGGFPNLTFINWSFVWRIFSGNAFHMYYLVIVIGLYFFAPLFRSYLYKINENSQKFFMNILLVLGITEVGFQYFYQACGTENFFTRWLPFTGLFVAGYVLTKNSQKFNKSKLFFLYALGLITTIGFNYFNLYLVIHKNLIMMPKGCLSNYTDYYMSINVVVMSIAAFLMLLSINYKRVTDNLLFTKAIQSIAKAAFGIYLLHPFVNRFLEVQFHLAVDFSPLPIAEIILLKIVLVFLISYIIAAIGRKIPVLKLAFGEK